MAGSNLLQEVAKPLESSVSLPLEDSKAARTSFDACDMTGIRGYGVALHDALMKRLVGLVIKASTSRAEDMGFESRLCPDFSGSSHTSDVKIDTLVATLPGAWRYRISAGTGWPGVSIL